MKGLVCLSLPPHSAPNPCADCRRGDREIKGSLVAGLSVGNSSSDSKEPAELGGQLRAPGSGRGKGWGLKSSGPGSAHTPPRASSPEQTSKC